MGLALITFLPIIILVAMVGWYNRYQGYFGMGPRKKLMLDFINKHGSLVVNRRGCFSVKQTSELTWLLKKGHIKIVRRPALYNNSYSVVVPVEPYSVTKPITCPDCGVNLEAMGAIWNTFVKGSSPYFDAAKHEYNCSMRIDHLYDNQRTKRRKK